MHGEVLAKVNGDCAQVTFPNNETYKYSTSILEDDITAGDYVIWALREDGKERYLYNSYDDNNAYMEKGRHIPNEEGDHTILEIIELDNHNVFWKWTEITEEEAFVEML